jgi:hypothetical protein
VQRQLINSPESGIKDDKQPVTKRKLPHYRYYKNLDKVFVVDRKGKETPTTLMSCTISPNVITHLQKEDKDRQVFDIWCEIKLPKTRDSEQPQLLRAHPTLDKFGGFLTGLTLGLKLRNNRVQTLMLIPYHLMSLVWHRQSC